jgi:hypothetical protein
MMNKKSPEERIYVESGETVEGFKIVEVVPQGGDPLGTVVRMMSGSVTGTVAFDEKLLTLKTAAPAAPAGGRPGQPGQPGVLPGQPGQPNQPVPGQPGTVPQIRPRVVPPPTAGAAPRTANSSRKHPRPSRWRRPLRTPRRSLIPTFPSLFHEVLMSFHRSLALLLVGWVSASAQQPAPQPPASTPAPAAEAPPAVPVPANPAAGQTQPIVPAPLPARLRPRLPLPARTKPRSHHLPCPCPLGSDPVPRPLPWWSRESRSRRSRRGRSCRRRETRRAAR